MWPYGVAGIVLALGLLFFHYRDNRNYVCEGCLSHRVRDQWKIGLWPRGSFPIGPKYERERPSHLFADLIQAPHRHEWVFVQGSPYGFFGATWGGCALGRGISGNDLSRAYEEFPAFRDFVQDKFRIGSLAREDFLEAALLSPYLEESPKASPRVRHLLAMDQALQQEFDRLPSPR